MFAFPDHSIWWMAWVGVAPLLIAVKFEMKSLPICFLLGWITGVVMFFGSCWWLAYAPIHYAGFPSVLAYLLVLLATMIVAVFIGIFAAGLAQLYRTFGNEALFAAPFLWLAVEYLRFALTGNAWNAIGYSQAFITEIVQPAKYGSFYLVGFMVLIFNAALAYAVLDRRRTSLYFFLTALGFANILIYISRPENIKQKGDIKIEGVVVAVQPNVPMSGLDLDKWKELRQMHVDMSERALQRNPAGKVPKLVVFPESPMNFMYERDSEFREFAHGFTARNRALLLVNSAEPVKDAEGLHNSAVMINDWGLKADQYDKVHLLPFGEYIPLPGFIADLVPPVVGNFTPGFDYTPMQFGKTKFGLMICFESHFPGLARRFVREGADYTIELTNDGYLGPTPVLKQHLANAIFRAVETGRPVYRVTNVGITAKITPSGQVVDATDPYVKDTRLWTVVKHEGGETLYVSFGDWFAVLCCLLSLALMLYSSRQQKF